MVASARRPSESPEHLIGCPNHISRTSTPFLRWVPQSACVPEADVQHRRPVSVSVLDPNTLARGLEVIGEEAIAKHDDDALDSYFAKGFLFHGPDGDATLDDLKQLWAGMRAAFTDFSVTREAMLVQGNMLAARTRMAGVFDHEYAYSPLGTVQPTGRPVSFQIINFFRYDDEGRLAEEWAQLDNLGLLR